ncbi:hypothetical protein KY312_03280 [Candidatus Woesearchaeota archaeon]|nr:hypothetical protein [Candidatus Woesearchaeota archaeon]
MKYVVLISIFVACLLFLTFTISDKDFLKLSYESSTKFDEVQLPLSPPYPMVATGLAIDEGSDWLTNSNEQLQMYKISPSALYVEVKNDFVYSNYYVYSDDGFEKFQLDGDKLSENWLLKTGTTFVDVTRFEPGKHYLIAYACEKSNDFDCNDEKWLFVAFETNSKRLFSEPYAKVEMNTRVPPPPPPVGEFE